MNILVMVPSIPCIAGKHTDKDTDTYYKTAEIYTTDSKSTYKQIQRHTFPTDDGAETVENFQH